MTFSPTYKNKVAFETLASLAFGSITDSFAAVGSASVSVIRIIKFTNLTNKDLIVSFDNSTNHEIIPAGTGVIWDFSTNKNTDDGFHFKQGTTVHVKRAGAVNPASGTFYLTRVFGDLA